MQESRRILLIGAGGHCRAVLDSLLALNCYEEIGLIDRKPSEMQEEDENYNPQDIIYECPFIGVDSDLELLFEEGYTEAFITVGSIGDTSIRRKIYNRLKQIGFQLPNIIDRTSIVSPFATLGEGVYIGKRAVVNANAYIGDCAIINTAAVIEHECTIGDFVHVAPGSTLCGNVTLGPDVHIGAGSIIRQGLKIGEGSVIGMGSVVLKDIASHITAYGNPCKEVKRHE